MLQLVAALVLGRQWLAPCSADLHEEVSASVAMMRPKGHHCPRDLELAADLELADDLRTSTISPIHLRRLRLPWHTELDAWSIAQALNILLET